MAEAEKAARKALEINKADCWAQHNVSYILSIVVYISTSCLCLNLK